MDLKFYSSKLNNTQFEINIPSDKSITHRALLISSLAVGESLIINPLLGSDCVATIDSLKDLNVDIKYQGSNIIVKGLGDNLDSFITPNNVIDLKNSGTSIRLLTGMLAGLNIDVILTGDSSLLKRPMKRVVEPLSQMGAKISLKDENFPPIEIQSTKLKKLIGINYKMPIASAQVKSSIMLAGINACQTSEIKIIQNMESRDHSERMLKFYGADIEFDNRVIVLKPSRIFARTVKIPGDLSSAAFFIVAVLIMDNSEILIKDVGINSTRTGVLKILKMMGADITLENFRKFNLEDVADIRVRSSKLVGVTIPNYLVPLAIDEFPIIFIAASCASGITKLVNASELKYKESNRILSMAKGLKKLGVQVAILDDGIIINGGKITGGIVDSYGDHRVAMSFAIAALRANGSIKVLNCDNIATSFPNFCDLAMKLGLKVTENINEY